MSDLSLIDMWNLLFTLQSNRTRFDQLRDRINEWKTPARYWSNPTAPDVYFDQFNAMMESTVYRKLSEIQAETLVLFGENDEVFPKVNSSIINNNVPNSYLHIVQGGSHSFLWEKMGEVTSRILEFL